MRMSVLSWLVLLLFSVSGVAARQVVDSRVLGLMRIGMTMFEVQERLGPPTDMQYGSVLASSPCRRSPQRTCPLSISARYWGRMTVIQHEGRRQGSIGKARHDTDASALRAHLEVARTRLTRTTLPATYVH
jgi:hypothetical protein